MYSHSVYTRSPVWLQETLLSTRELARKWLREGQSFHRVLREIEESQWFNAEELAAYQLKRLRQIFGQASLHVPYYREVFRAHSLLPGEIGDLRDVSKIPFLSKRDVAAEPRLFVRDNVSGRLFRGNTSGTTGTPLTLYQDVSAIVREHAFVHRLLGWAGFRAGDRRAWIRGDMIVPAEQENPPFWRMNHPDNMLMMSSYHLSERNAGAYMEALERFDPGLIQAYPSSIGFLAAYLSSRSRLYRGSRLRAVVTSSETLSPETKMLVEQSFGCPVFDHYGSFERVTFVSSCEKGSLHVHADYGYFEVLSDDGTSSGEIVGTGFNNSVMPLLRYRTGDRVVMANAGSRCLCGRYWPIVDRIGGRQDDYVVTKDGRHITRLGHVFTGVPGVAEGQIIQEQIGKVQILVVPLGNGAVDVERYVRARAVERFGPMMEVDVRTVSRIAREKSGKLRLVIRSAKI